MSKKLRVLLTNDDGPPGPESPYIFAFSQHLKHSLEIKPQNIGWDVKVVLPSSQKSWIGKAFHIKEIVKGSYFYPCKPSGVGKHSPVSRPLDVEQGEEEEWILLDATPATCANVALHNLFPGEIDLVISGPNLGRNSSAAFALSSGTIGASLSSALSQVRSVAVSYGTVVRPTPADFHSPAHQLTGRIIQKLWGSWGKIDGALRNGEIDLYNINIPMVEGLLTPTSLEVCWTRMWRNSYGRLFRPLPDPLRDKAFPPVIKNILEAGPDSDKQGNLSMQFSGVQPVQTDPTALAFQFAPEFQRIIDPDPLSLPEGTDAWALWKGCASVTPLMASFAEPYTGPHTWSAFWDDQEEGLSDNRSRKLRL